MITEDTKILVKTLKDCPGLWQNKVCPEYPTPSELKKGWDKVTQILNMSGDGKHAKWTSHAVRRKWNDLRNRARKKAKAIEEMLENGERPGARLSELEKLVLAMENPTESSFVSAPQKSPKKKKAKKKTSDKKEKKDASCKKKVRKEQETVGKEQESPQANGLDPNSFSLDMPTAWMDDCDTVDLPIDDMESSGTITRLGGDSDFRELCSMQKNKLDIRKKELLIKEEKLEIKRQKIELSKKHLTVQVNILNQLKNISKLLEKQTNS